MRTERTKPTVVLAALVVVAAALRYAAARTIPTPWIAPDELLYALLGRGLWSTGHLSVLGVEQGFYTLFYPLLVGLPLQLGDLARGYGIVKALQALVMSATAIPVYLWSRSLVRPRWALAAALLTVAIPGLVYAGLLMTEVLFYPVCVLAAWAAASMLERPLVHRQLLFAAVVGLAVLTRLQLLVLLPATLTAIALKALLDRDLRVVRATWPLDVVVVAALGALAAGGPSSAGGYASAATAGYDATAIVHFVAYHGAALLLLCGVVPVCAVALLALDALRGREASAAARAYLAVAVSLCVWIVVEVGLFASEHGGKIEERNLLGLAPVVFVGFALWLDRGAPRSYAAAASVAFVAAAAVVLFPFRRFVTEVNAPDSATFDAALHVHSIRPALLLGVPAVALALAFVLLPRRLAPLLVVALVLLFGAASVAASLQVRDESRFRQALLLGPDPRWVDRAAGGAPVGYVYTGGTFFNTVWEHAFWNRAVRRVYVTPGAQVPGPIPQTRVRWGADGVLRAGGRPIRERFLVLPNTLTAVGDPAASTTLAGSDVTGLTLWRLTGPPRIGETVVGRLPNGDVYSEATMRAFGCTGGSFTVTLFGKTSEDVDVLLDDRRVKRVHLEANQAATETVPVPANSDPLHVCRLTLRPTTTLGTTVWRFDRG